jgi:hypothetical protein
MRQPRQKRERQVEPPLIPQTPLDPGIRGNQFIPRQPGPVQKPETEQSRGEIQPCRAGGGEPRIGGHNEDQYRAQGVKRGEAPQPFHPKRKRRKVAFGIDGLSPEQEAGNHEEDQDSALAEKEHEVRVAGPRPGAQPLTSDIGVVNKDTPGHEPAESIQRERPLRTDSKHGFIKAGFSGYKPCSDYRKASAQDGTQNSVKDIVHAAQRKTKHGSYHRCEQLSLRLLLRQNDLERIKNHTRMAVILHVVLGFRPMP